MSYDSVLAFGILLVLAVAGSSGFVRIASNHEQRIYLKEQADHLEARRRRLFTLDRSLEAGSLIAEPAVLPARRLRAGVPRLRLRYAAIVALVAVWPTSSGQTPHETAPAPTAVQTPAKTTCRRTIIAARPASGEACPESLRRNIC